MILQVALVLAAAAVTIAGSGIFGCFAVLAARP
jgi:hypothetical protein